ncbi:S phase cyclin A-associated protein in the endoplasmic reticulum-like isoform X2 [Elysia marginata]|uniref:S phase cyclin A-associated protein in the endoplasmic reticulum-like isoform X2 n=1 Tax=Elysia marginata TaxID=1093978 RepID=A0AAV4G4M2_9GAST|nr:S phase cyclin A-associated protein in the endoplasmic reticulum-like isoform X2 [Elysia marginata]
MMSENRRKRGAAWNTKLRQEHRERDRESHQNGAGENAGQHHQKTRYSNVQKGRTANTQNQHNSRPNGLDSIRKIVQEEGRTARNLVQYNVPVLENQSEGTTSSGAVSSSRSSSQQKRTGSSSRVQSHCTPPPSYRSRHRSLSEMAKSPRSDAGSKKNDLRARYWKYMFDNFQRAVDSIYQTCEQDESVVECKEVIMMLEQSTKDFKALIETLNMMKAYEDSAKEGDRPAAVAWEVRKMSPNKHAPSSPAPGQQQPVLGLERSGNSWADKVRGVRAINFTAGHPGSGEPVTPTKQTAQAMPTLPKPKSAPAVWKRSEIIPVPKSKSAKNLNDFRPVALTSVAFKCLERIVLGHLLQDSENQFDPMQFAYRKNRSLDDALLVFLNNITKHLDVPKSYARDLDLVLDEEYQLSSQLEKAQKSALAYAVQEEENWLKELAREQSSGVGEVEDLDSASDLANTNSSLDNSQPSITDWESLVAAHEAEAKKNPLASWGDMVEAEETRTPGHGVHMHEKLSSPSRKRSPTESRRRHEEKQAKAQEQREKLMQEKAERLRDLSKKVEEVRAYKEELMRQNKTLLEHKLQRAEEKRQCQLKLKARKAHEEEAKANEIAFINSLEAQNKRHDIMSKHQESEARLHDLMEERHRKMEEKQAKEAAVEERRKALEADRKARLLEMQEKRKLRDARIEQQQIEKEKERLEAVRVKGKEREERIAALNAMQEAHKQVLQKKIQQKQDETTQRHEEYLKQIRERAFEMSIMRHSTEDHNDAPMLTPYDRNKLCIICNALIPSEVYLLSHLRGKKHQQALKDNNSGKEMTKEEIESFNLKHIVDAPANSNHPKIVTEKERQKSLKKRCKKLRNRMVMRGAEYENGASNKQPSADSEHKAKLNKVIKDINKYLQSQDTGPWQQNKVLALDRALGEIGRILEKKSLSDQTCFRVLGGFTSLSRVLMTIDDATRALPCVIPAKSLTHAADIYKLACRNHFDNCHYLLFSNKIGIMVDHLINRLNDMIPEDLGRPGYIPSATRGGSSNSSTTSDCGEPNQLPFDPVCCSLMQVLGMVLTCLAKNNPASNCSEASAERMTATGDAFMNRGNDIIR